MIEKISAYKSSDGKFVGAIEDVQKHELLLLLKPLSHQRTVPSQVEVPLDIQLDVAIKQIVEQRDKVLDILSTGPRSKPKARAINGGRKNRTLKIPADEGKPSTPAGAQA